MGAAKMQINLDIGIRRLDLNDEGMRSICIPNGPWPRTRSSFAPRKLAAGLKE